MESNATASVAAVEPRAVNVPCSRQPCQRHRHWPGRGSSCAIAVNESSYENIWRPAVVCSCLNTVSSGRRPLRSHASVIQLAIGQQSGQA
ncbi:hypothetical protein MTO96_000491 [Rhipicephalus appendiculatus]